MFTQIPAGVRVHVFTQIPAGVRVHVSLDRYSQDLAYTFICKNEVSRGVCQAEAAELWAGWFGC